MIDGRRGCTLPNPGNNEKPTFQITGGVDGAIDDLRWQTENSVNCAFSRLAQIVGLGRMVDTVYRSAKNPYLFRGQSAEERQPISPFGSFAIGANEMSTLDMASGIQTIANEGVHIEPYYVEYIDDALGNRVYTHAPVGTQVFDRQVALTAIDVFKGVLTKGTGRRELADFASRNPAAFGKTGTQDKNWTAFFVGATPFLSTAVLVRDPDRYTPMADIPEFVAAGVQRVQGGTFPARIWGAFMDPIGLERVGLDADWEPPAAPARRASRLYLPGNECVFQIVGYEPAETTPDSSPGGGDTGDGGGADGFRTPERSALADHDDHRRTGRLDTGQHHHDDAAEARLCPCRERHYHPGRCRRPERATPVRPARSPRASVLTGGRPHEPPAARSPSRRHARGSTPPSTRPPARARRGRPRPGSARCVAAQRDALRGRIAELEATIGRTEAESHEIDTHRARLDKQMKTIISPREAEALQHELALLAERRSGLDDVELEALEEQSAIDDQIAAAALEEQPLTDAVGAATELALAAEAQIEADLAGIAASLDALRAAVPADLLARYDQARKQQMVAAAELQGHRCSGCHLDLSPGEVDIVKDATASDGIADCPNCNRLLVIPSRLS